MEVKVYDVGKLCNNARADHLSWERRLCRNGWRKIRFRQCCQVEKDFLIQNIYSCFKISFYTMAKIPCLNKAKITYKSQKKSDPDQATAAGNIFGFFDAGILLSHYKAARKYYEQLKRDNIFCWFCALLRWELKKIFSTDPRARRRIWDTPACLTLNYIDQNRLWQMRCCCWTHRLSRCRTAMPLMPVDLAPHPHPPSHPRRWSRPPRQTIPAVGGLSAVRSRVVIGSDRLLSSGWATSPDAWKINWLLKPINEIFRSYNT